MTVGEVQRGSTRFNSFLTGIIRFAATSRPIRIRNISSTGALIEGLGLPTVDSSVILSRGSLCADGVVVWCKHQKSGVRFEKPISIEDWLPSVTINSAQLNVDTLIASVRSGRADNGKPERKAIETSPIPDLTSRLAEELAYVMRLLDSLGDDLSSEPAVLARHSDKLQNLDISTQILGQIARILTAAEPEKAIETIGMESLRRRLQRISISSICE